MTHTPELPYLEVSRDGWTKGIQLSINDAGGGYRLGGPKFNGSQVTLCKVTLTEAVCRELEIYIRKARAALAKAGAA